METWTRRSSKDGEVLAPIPSDGIRAPILLPPGEPPICCPETRKDPTVSKPVFPSGSFECPPEEGGCGSIWTKER